MNILVLLAGGIGNRMNSADLPKQFLLVANKPIIVYTLERFEQSSDVDKIIVVCKEGYFNLVRQYINDFKIKKVIDIVEGGSTRQDSLFNGVVAAFKLSSNPNEDILLIHDAVRPVVSYDLIKKVVDGAKEHGACISVGKPVETLMITDDKGVVIDVKDRSICRTGKAPHAYNLDLLYRVFNKSIVEHKKDYIDDESMMFDNGVRIYTVESSDTNIKITTQLDYAAFRHYVLEKEESQFKK